MKTLFILLLLAFIPHPASASSSRADELESGQQVNYTISRLLLARG